jgi:hypothetical protein
MHREYENGDGHRSGDHRKPKNSPEVVGERDHQDESEQRTHEGADRVELLSQPVGRFAHGRRSDVGDQSVARRAPDALTDPVGEARHEHEAEPAREADGERLGAEVKALFSNHGRVWLKNAALQAAK